MGKSYKATKHSVNEHGENMNRLNYELDSVRFENALLNDKLKEFERKYRIIYEENPSMFFTVDADGMVVSVNSYGAKQLGYTKDELIGNSVLDVFHPEDKKKVLNQLKKCLRNPERLYQWDLRKIRRDGTVMWGRESARVVKGDVGRNVVLIACEDITNRKRSEEALRKAHQKLEIRVSERTEELTKANEALQSEITERINMERALNENLSKLSKKNRYETIISTVTRSVHQSIDLQEVLENSVEAMSENIDVVEHVAIYLVEDKEAVMKAYRGHPDWFVKRIRRIPYPKGFTWKTIIDGRPIYCADVDKDTVIGPAGKEVGTKSYASMPLLYKGKTVGSINVHSFHKDAFDDEELQLLDIVGKQIGIAIKNAKQAEALQESEEKYRSLVEQTNDWVWEIDENGIFTYVNPKVREVIGYEPEELLGKTSFDFMTPDEVLRVSDVMSPFVSQQKPFKRLERKLIHKDGRKVFLEVSGSPMFGSEGVFKGYHGVVQNITDRKRTEEELLTLNDITQAMNRSLDLDEIYKIALDRVIEQEYVDLACIYLVDNSKNEAVMQAHRNFSDDFIKRAERIPYPKGATWKVVNTQEIINVKNASEDPDVGSAGRDLGFRSMLGIPVAIEGNTVGVL